MKIKKWVCVGLAVILALLLLVWLLHLIFAPVKIGTTREEYVNIPIAKKTYVPFDRNYSYYISKTGMEYVVQWKDDRVVAQWANYPFLTTRGAWGYRLLWEGMTEAQVLGFLGCEGYGYSIYPTYSIRFDEDGRLKYLLYHEDPMISYAQQVSPLPRWTPWAFLGGIVLIAGTTTAIILIRRKKKQEAPAE